MLWLAQLWIMPCRQFASWPPGPASSHPMSLHRMKHAAEQVGSNAPTVVVIVRPIAFMETRLTVIGAKLASGGPALVLPPGRRQP